MKLEHLVGDRFKERPADCQVDSHALMVRGGYIKYVANGIYSSYPPLKRVLTPALPCFSLWTEAVIFLSRHHAAA